MKLKKAISLLLCSLLVVAILCAAASAQSFTARSGNAEVVIEHSGLNSETLNGIAQTLLTGAAPAASAPNPWCIINGHSIERVGAEIIRHKVYATQPRCIQESYDVERCTRCDYANYELLGTVPIYCCK